MAIQSVNGGLVIPDWYTAVINTMQQSTLATLTATDHKIAFVFQIPKSGDITHIQYKTGTVTANAASRLYVDLQTIDGSGNPSGTGYKGATAGNHGSAPASNTWYRTALGTQATAVVKNDFVAVVAGYGVFTAADSVIVATANSPSSMTAGFPYLNYYTSSWAKQTANRGMFAIEYSDGSFAFIPQTYPVTTFAQQSFASNTAVTDEYALSFEFPWDCEVSGFGGGFDLDGTVEVAIYSGTSVVGTALTLTSEKRASTARNVNEYSFDSPIALSKNTRYRLSFRPTTTTAIQLTILQLDSAALLDQMCGQKFRLGTRLDVGSWDSDTLTRVPVVYLRVSGIDVPSSGVSRARVQRGM